MTKNRILRTRAAAEYVGLAPATLEKMRLVGTGPSYLKLGGRAVGYDIADLNAWVRKLRRANKAGQQSKG